MITKFATNWKVDGVFSHIKSVQIDREDENNVYIGHVRQPKNLWPTRYFDTWEEAQSCLVDHYYGAQIAAKRHYDDAKNRLNEVVRLTESS